MGKDPRKNRKPVRRRAWDPSDADTLTRESRARREDRGAVRLPPLAKEFFSDTPANALVIGPYGALAFVLWNGAEHLCRVDDALMDGKSSVLAPGDDVQVEADSGGPVVRAVRHRRTKLSRPAIGRSREQVLAANIDCVVVVASAAKPQFNPGLVDRYLVAAQAGGARPILCINKMDLVSAEPREVEPYREFDLAIFETSCQNRAGLDALSDALAGKLSVLTGHSGVGKSSIINALEPSLSIDTQDISESTKKGRHTTTSSRLYELPNGARIIDTPGIKQLGLWGISPEELDYYFHELAERAEKCRFRDCTHVHEPHCAVKDAVEVSEISLARYESYLRIRKALVEETTPKY
ncbi:MAG: ribosome small subunit-dependent GTPase A [Candidatus Hydrogenedentes bacterium]|nr:ribosome small subunit-dependent GTPase A [Candidatus Hydrogenedentota bacterium]